MKKTCIVTDSCSGISQEEAKELGIRLLAMPFYINETTYHEGIDLSREEFLKLQAEGASISTSQPAPFDVTGLWDEILKEYDEIVHLPLSSGLSGSYGTAAAMATDEDYEGKVFVVDHGRISAPLHALILDAVSLVNMGYSAKEIKEMAEKAVDDMSIYISVDTLEYLKKGGRVTPAAAAMGAILNIKPILKLGAGKLDSFKKCRGMGKARAASIEALKEDLETRFKEDYVNKNLHLFVATSASEEETASYVAQVKEAFPGYPVLVDNLSLAVTGHTGPGALACGFSKKL